MGQEKTCNRCKAQKPLGDFQNNRAAKDGKQARCRDCQNTTNRASQIRHIEKTRAYVRAYKERHPEKVKAINAQWRAENSDHLVEYQRAYYEANKERLLANDRERYAREGRDRNPEVTRAYVRRRRARLADAYIAEVIEADLILRDEGVCGICLLPLDGPNFHVDHILPLAAGGTHEPDNCQLAHPACNVRKQHRVDYAATA